MVFVAVVVLIVVGALASCGYVVSKLTPAQRRDIGIGPIEE